MADGRVPVVGGAGNYPVNRNVLRIDPGDSETKIIATIAIEIQHAAAPHVGVLDIAEA